MTEDDRRRWNERYAAGYPGSHLPSPFLEEVLPLLPRGRALVLACGSGRNAIRLAEAGFAVDAIDISDVAIARAREAAAERGVDVRWIVADLDAYDLPEGAYDLVTMIRFVDRRIWPEAVRALRADGWLLIEQHLRTYLAVAGPEDDEVRVGPNELLDAFASLRAIRYAELLEARRPGERPFALARYLGCRGDPGF